MREKNAKLYTQLKRNKEAELLFPKIIYSPHFQASENYNNYNDCYSFVLITRQ